MTTQKIKDNYSDEVRLALLEQSINNINDTLIRFEKRFDQLDMKIDSLHKWTLGLIRGLYLLLGGLFFTLFSKFIH